MTYRGAVEFQQLRYFAAVALHGSFNAAAARLHVTQPAVSRQVKNLEGELGVKLFDRSANKLTLTAEGEAFYEDARDLLARADQAVRSLGARSRGEPLRVGYVPSLMAGILPRAIEQFHLASSQVRIELSDLNPQKMSEMASAGLIDVAILPNGLESKVPDFQWTELHSLYPVLVMPRSHPLAKLKKIPPQRLRETRLLGLAHAHFPDYAPRLRAMLKPLGIKVVLDTHSGDSLATIFAALEAEKGLAMLTEGIADMLPSSLVTRPFSPALTPVVVLAGLPVVQASPHAEVFVRLLREQVDRRVKH